MKDAGQDVTVVDRSAEKLRALADGVGVETETSTADAVHGATSRSSPFASTSLSVSWRRSGTISRARSWST
jgi:hypothetical protein